MDAHYDFSGWATRNDLKCSDGRTIRKDAFKDCDGKIVPLVWNHQHNSADNVLGHALLENREEGVYTYGYFNDTEMGNTGKELVQHGDVEALSIYANKLKESKNGDVYHGIIREVSLVLGGANPGAFIDSVAMHSDESEEPEMEGVIYTGEPIALAHSNEKTENGDGEMKEDTESKSTGADEKTVQDVLDTFTEEQKKVMYYFMYLASKGEVPDSVKEGEENMKHNVFDEDTAENSLQHGLFTDEQQNAILSDAKKYGSVKESFLAHAGEYGITDIDWLYPEDRNLNNPPEFIKRDTSWVSKVMGSVHHTPFSRIKSQFANITEDEARAKGYIKGNLKKEEVFSLLKRSTSPQTIYKKQKLDRDDIIDITDFDVVSWIKGEMRIMLDEEIARAVLLGDGRLASDDDKISEDHIRPVVSDADLYTIKVGVEEGDDDDTTAKNFIRAAIKARKNYKGTGTPTLYTTEDMLTNMLLITDGIGRDLYDSEAKLATKLRVKEIVTVEVMESAKGPNGGDLLGVIVNLADYNVGADKGGAVSMFEDFDIDYNQQKYLMETRCSGALVRPYSAIELEVAPSEEEDDNG